MPINDWQTIETSLTPPPDAPPDTARTYTIVAEAVPAGFTERTKLYSTLSEMEDDGWSAAFSAYNAYADLLAQPPTVTAVGTMIFIRRDAAVAEVWPFLIPDDTDGDKELFINGVLAATFTASSNTVTEIRDGLLISLAAGAFAATFTGGAVAADAGTVTNNTAGVPFVLTSAASAGTAPEIAATPTIASVGIYDDLTAAHLERKFWGVITPAASDADNDEAQRWTNADRTTRRNFLFAQTSDVNVYDPGDTDNLAVQWLTAKVPRANLLQHPNATEYMAAAAVGRLGGAFPGSRAWHRIALTGSLETAISSTRTTEATTTMKARLMSWTERFDGPTSDLELLWGAIASGNFIFQRHAEDHWWYTIGAVVSGVLKSNAGVNLDEEGLQGLAEAVSQATIPFVDAGVIAPDYTVTFIPIEDVPAGEIAIGDYKTTGAILVEATITPKLRSLRVSATFALV